MAKAISLEELWQGDLLDRKSEAELLIAYIESVSQGSQAGSDPSGYTIAVDAGYGEGKTYFLKRLARQLAENHPVAFVDAWTDDLADEPLTALAATLKRALFELAERKPDIKSKFDIVLEKTGSVAKVASKGLFKRGLGLLITGAAVDGIETIITSTSEAVKDAVTDGLSDIGEDLVEDVANSFAAANPTELMQNRIKHFEEGQQAIADLRRSLESLVSSLDNHEKHAPIVIIIDELDRCRPTYAVKLLEEVKHLFDVPGLIFIFGLHTGQLAHSVSGAYGPSFDGRAYLARFVRRHYRLKQPDLAPFIRYLIEQLGIKPERLWFPNIVEIFNTSRSSNLSDILAYYLQEYNMSARDAITVIEIIQTCCAVTENQELLMPLLLPMIIAKVKGYDRGQLCEPSSANRRLAFNFHDHDTNDSFQRNWWDTATFLIGLTRMNENEKRSFISTNNNKLVEIYGEFLRVARSPSRKLSNPDFYADLLEAVGRFSSDPSIT